MLKKFVVAGFAFFLFMVFSNAAWSSVTGNWHVKGKITTKVSAKGQKTKNMAWNIDDIWTFSGDQVFQAEDVKGFWNQTGKKFVVDLNQEDIISNFEDMMTEEFGTDISVDEITKMTAKGTEQKNGKMNVVLSITMKVYAEEPGISGTAKVSGVFNGTFIQTPTADVSGYWNVYHTEKGKKAEQGPDYFSLNQDEFIIGGSFIVGTGEDQGLVYPAFGILSGSSLSITTYQEDFEVNIDGTVSGSTMSGTYKTSEGHPGKWRAEKADSIPF